MLKIYAKREDEMRLLPILAEFKARVIVNYPVKGHTRKVKGKNAYKVISFPIDQKLIEFNRSVALINEDYNKVARKKGWRIVMSGCARCGQIMKPDGSCDNCGIVFKP